MTGLTLDAVHLRHMTADDLDRVRAWRNAPSIRRAMYTDHVITPAEHDRWWAALSVRDDARLLIAEAAGRGPVGFVSVTEIDRRHGTCSWAFYADPDNPPKGLGTLMEIRALDLMAGELGIRKITCEVLAFNERVIALHKRFGFVEEGVFREHKIKDGTAVDVVRLAFFTRDWPERRAAMSHSFCAPALHVEAHGY